MTPTAAAAALLVFALPALAGQETHRHGAHVHGVAELEVAVDGGSLGIHLESPLANLVGFEHAPKTAAQRAQANAALAALKQGERLFAPTQAAGCRLVEATVAAPVLEGRGGQDGHGDVDADYRFQCARPGELKGLDARLFEPFGGLARVDAAVVSDRGQQAYRLTRHLHFMAW